jgi:hypothetical protein
VEHDERTVEGNNRSTKTHSSNAQGVVKNQHWVKKGLLLKNAQQIFWATAENWASNRAHKAAHTAHSKQSKRFNALFLRSSHSNKAAQCYKQRVGRFTGLCLRYVAVAF